MENYLTDAVVKIVEEQNVMFSGSEAREEVVDEEARKEDGDSSRQRADEGDARAEAGMSQDGIGTNEEVEDAKDKELRKCFITNKNEQLSEGSIS
ncbi:uncharacterized protein MONOS_14052 [Monocercomonoides exilis]|uniref:uncharacterized protein n=1 Tax=Monocercomonoides exilis TaxID=2049356 RepID=UPI00355958BF|nr:hypothetical protein MONOS_14052 [Monocercomonoides exilis]|eukprot:MONOS_14052.1-p1 / transcript=MONOS_14052.1 / gene=MONOS_14052 / organism=Monocercomonoides_exilis_PA203 / gene_product=unspecified product / transcript_product=unspecified product / location=Mono_scaffold00928:6776-7133(-) / protein_length=95 / sequence_SO=supercontig / SO=protein_coding / is_pseudo=false